MVKIKNVRPGILIIADAGLKLTPGESRDVEELTPQAMEAISAGLLAQVDKEQEAKPKAKSNSRTAEGKSDSKKPTNATPKADEASGPEENAGEPAATDSQGQLLGTGDGTD